MTRAIQIGTTTVQGHVTATWPDPMGEHGSIVSQGVRYTGRLGGGRGNSENRPDRLADKGEGGGRRVSNIEKFDSAVEGLTEHERLAKAPWAESNLQKPQITPAGGGALSDGNRPDRLSNKGAGGGDLGGNIKEFDNAREARDA